MAAIITNTQFATFTGLTATAQQTAIIAAVQADLEYAMFGSHDITGGTTTLPGFTQQTYTEYLDGCGASNLILRVWPVASVTTLKVVNPADLSVLYTFTTSDYTIDLPRGHIQLHNSAGWNWFGDSGFYTDNTGLPMLERIGQSPGFGVGSRKIQAVYVGGYTTFPTWLESAMYGLVATRLGGAARDASLQSETLGKYSYSVNAAGGQFGDNKYATTYDAQIAQIVAKYGRPSS